MIPPDKLRALLADHPPLHLLAKGLALLVAGHMGARWVEVRRHNANLRTLRA